MRKHSFQFNQIEATIRDTLATMKDARLWMVASSLAYTTLLSIVPLLAVSFSIFQAFGGLIKVQQALQPLIAENFTESMGAQISETLVMFASRINASTLGFTGLLALTATCMSLLSNADKAIHGVWGTPIKRTAFQRFATYWLFVTFGPIAMAVALGAATGLELRWVRVIPSGIAGFAFTTFIFFSTHKWIPDRHVSALSALISALYTSTAFHLVRFGFAIYARHVVTVHKVYGPLSAIPVFMFWVYLQWLVFFSGVALTAVLQRRKERRT